MTDKIEIRDHTPEDRSAVFALYPKAFPEEDLLPVVEAVLEMREGVLILNAFDGVDLVGNVIFTACRIDGTDQRAALLAPLAVTPGRQRKGIGSALVRQGLRRLKDAGFARVFVLGDPAYYRRFGFAPDAGVSPPYPLPDGWYDAWRSCALSESAPAAHGSLQVAEPWRRPALWGA